MSKFLRGAILVGCLGLLAVGVVWLFGAKAPANIQLRATFAPAMDDGTPATFLNDAKGAYVTDGRHNVSVWITGDLGELFFKFEHHSARSMRILFPNAGSVECGMLPDTTGLYPELPDEPVDFFRFATHNGPAFLGPQVNLLSMAPNVPTPMRLWTTICTTVRHYFLLNYVPNVGTITGTVLVTAYPDTKGQLVQWVIEPSFADSYMADIYKHPETGNENINCYFGTFPMPFKLILTRI